MKKMNIQKVLSRTIVAVCMASMLSLVMVMPKAKAADDCPLYGYHIYNIHHDANSVYNDTSSHTYTYYINAGQPVSSSCTYTRHHRYYYAKCACDVINYGVTHDHVRMEFHPGASGQPNGCGSGYRNIDLPNDL